MKNYEYKSEILETTMKWGFKDSADKKDIENLDKLINTRTNEGWQFVTYAYMPNVMAARSAILIAFKRQL